MTLFISDGKTTSASCVQLCADKHKVARDIKNVVYCSTLTSTCTAAQQKPTVTSSLFIL